MEIKRCYDTLIGASVAENQLKDISSVSSGTVNGVTFTNNGDGSVTASGTATADTQFDLGSSRLSANHKYLIIGCPSGGSATTYYMGNASYMDTGNGKIFDSGSASATGYRIYVQNGVQINKTFYPQLIDLTQKFGSTIADYAYTLEQATAGSGIAWLRSYGFLGGYVPYSAGSIESVEVTEKKVVGFNQWDEEWERYGVSQVRSKNRIPVLTGVTYYAKTPSVGISIYFKAQITDTDNVGFASVTNSTFTVPVNAHYAIIYTNTGYGTTYNHDICINLSSDRNGEYEPYKSITYPLGSDVLRGIFKLANGKIYADGDRKTSDGTITRRYGSHDLGSLNWTKTTATNIDVGYLFQTGIALSVSGSLNCILDNYVFLDKIGLSANVAAYGSGLDKVAFRSSNRNIYIIDSSYNDGGSFKTAMNGHMLVYELETPTTESADPFASPQVCYPDGTEEYVTSNGVPVGHETEYQL